MKGKTIFGLLLLGAGGALSSAHAQSSPSVGMAPEQGREITAADLDGLRAELRSSKKQAIASNLKLTDAEATRFWPVYDRYAADVTKIKNDQYALVAEYVNKFGNFDDAAATNFITRWLDVDVRMTALRASYVPIVGKVLPGIKTTTFFQIDRRLQMVIDLRIASGLPILQLQAGK